MTLTILIPIVLAFPSTAAVPRVHKTQNIPVSLIPEVYSSIDPCYFSITVYGNHLEPFILQQQAQMYVHDPSRNPQIRNITRGWLDLEPLRFRHIHCITHTFVVTTHASALPPHLKGNENGQDLEISRQTYQTTVLLFCADNFLKSCNYIASLFLLDSTVLLIPFKLVSDTTDLKPVDRLSITLVSRLFNQDVGRPNSLTLPCASVSRCLRKAQDEYTLAFMQSTAWLVRSSECGKDGPMFRRDKKENSTPKYSQREVIQFVMESLNASEIECRQAAYHIPMLTTDQAQLKFNCKPELWVNSHDMHLFESSDPEVVFITIDGVREDKTTWSQYATPLEGPVWLVLILAAVLTTASLVVLHSGSKMADKTKLFWDLLWRIFVLLLEKSITILPGKPFAEHVRGQYLRCLLASVIIGKWLLLVTLLPSAYKAVFKASYFFGPTFMTKWTQLKDLENFSVLVFPVESYDACQKYEISQQFLISSLSVNPTSFCQNEGYTSLWPCYSSVEYQSLISNHGFRLKYPTCSASSVITCKHTEFRTLHNLLSSIVFACKNELAQILNTTLIESETALVVPRESFHEYWTMVTSPAHHVPGKHLAHNFRSEDKAFKNPERLCVRGSMPWAGHTDVHKKLRLLTESGISMLWKRLQRQDVYYDVTVWAYNFNRPRISDDPISFRHSYIHLVFYGYLILMALCCAVLALESLITRISCRSSQGEIVVSFSVSKTCK